MWTRILLTCLGIVSGTVVVPGESPVADGAVEETMERAMEKDSGSVTVVRPTIDELIPLEREPSPGDSGMFTDTEGRAIVSFFGLETTGTSFVFLVDSSASTGGRGNLTLPLIRAQVDRSLRRLDEVHRFGIVVYGESPRWYRPASAAGPVTFATEENRERASRFLRTVRSGGNTDHLRALREALRVRPDVLFWMTDGEDPKLSREELDELRELAAGTRIYTLEFGVGDAPESPGFLKIAAEENGGTHRWIDLIATLREFLERQRKGNTGTSAPSR
ncbi:MAG: hypothetical protein Q4C47_01565 [Planctomycetia bacterium]|nr:hypothetical protein [Planctomycetia bacterium]